MTIFLIILILIFGYIVINWILDNQASEENVEATLMKKKTSTYMDANNVMHTSYILVFDIDGNVKGFTVNRKIYKQYCENQKGTLIYKRKRFVDFLIS